MRYFIIAGEVSGDMHGSRLVHCLRDVDASAEVVGWGGDMLAGEGVQIQKHINDLAFMGFVEVVKNLKTILTNFRQCRQQIKRYNPDKIIFVDYPGFNLRMTKWAKRHGFKTLYFISPNVWAWRKNRVYTIRDNVDKMYVILPFEQSFYANFGIDVAYFGHPLVATIQAYRPVSEAEFRRRHALPDKPIVAMMSGSRRQEVAKILPVMLQTAARFPEYVFLLAGVETVGKAFYDSILRRYAVANVRLLFGSTYEILSHSVAGLIKSGTATLEAALFGVPQVVCYKADALSVLIARAVAKVKYISLVNLIMDEPAVVELIQNDLQPERLTRELNNILPGGANRAIMTQKYQLLLQRLQNADVYQHIAADMVKQ